MNNARREFNGARLHPLLEEILISGANLLRCAQRRKKIKNADFIALAIPELARRGLIYLINPKIGIPTNLNGVDARAAEEQVGPSLWMPTNDLAKRWIYIWDELLPAFPGDDIVTAKAARAKNENPRLN